MLTTERIEHLLNRIPQLTIGIVGDLFLDRYLDISAELTEKSVETDLDAYQVTRVRSIPGAVGTVINNLVALGVKRVVPVSIIGDDGEGYELRQALDNLKAVDQSHVFSAKDRRTPTYTKPMLGRANRPARELNRLDIKNRNPTPEPLQDMMMESLTAIWPQVDALIALDQVSEAECGVVTTPVREHLATLGQGDPARFVLADSRRLIDRFRYVCLKPNMDECRQAGGERGGQNAVQVGAARLASVAQRSVFCTCGEAGIWLVDLHAPAAAPLLIPACRVDGEIDIVGAGDSTSAGITSAIAAGASYAEAAAFGCLVASITIQQLGTTGTASPQQVRQRWREMQTSVGR